MKQTVLFRASLRSVLRVTVHWVCCSPMNKVIRIWILTKQQLWPRMKKRGGWLSLCNYKDPLRSFQLFKQEFYNPYSKPVPYAKDVQVA